MANILTSIHGKRFGLSQSKRLLIERPADNTLVGLPRVVYTNTAASTAISNTASETAFDTSYSIPANTLEVGQLIRVRYQGIATSTNAADTLLIKAYLNSTALLTGTATDVANNAAFWGDFDVIIRTVGASGTFVSAGSHSEVPAASGTATPVYELTASTAIDTTAAATLTVKATWSAASASNSVRMDLFSVQIS